MFGSPNVNSILYFDTLASAKIFVLAINEVGT